MKEIISVIVPVYNAQKTLRRCINTLLQQTYSELDIILVNDGSTDESALICRKMAEKDSRIRYFEIENSGPSHARNVGIEYAVGKYLVFVDSDDFVEPDYVEQLVNMQEQVSSDTLVLCGYYREFQQEQNRSEIQTFENDKDSEVERQDFLLLMERCLSNSLWNKIFQKQVIEKAHIRMDREFSIGEDLLFNLKYIDAAECRKIVCVNRPLYHYVITGNGSLDHSYNEKRLDMLQQLYDVELFYCSKWQLRQMDILYRLMYYHVRDMLIEVEADINGFTDEQKRCKGQKILDSKLCRINVLRWPIPWYVKEAYRSRNYKIVHKAEQLFVLTKRIKHRLWRE